VATMLSQLHDRICHPLVMPEWHKTGGAKKWLQKVASATSVSKTGTLNSFKSSLIELEGAMRSYYVSDALIKLNWTLKRKYFLDAVDSARTYARLAYLICSFQSDIVDYCNQQCAITEECEDKQCLQLVSDDNKVQTLPKVDETYVYFGEGHAQSIASYREANERFLADSVLRVLQSDGAKRGIHVVKVTKITYHPGIAYGPTPYLRVYVEPVSAEESKEFASKSYAKSTAVGGGPLNAGAPPKVESKTEAAKSETVDGKNGVSSVSNDDMDTEGAKETVEVKSSSIPYSDVNGPFVVICPVSSVSPDFLVPQEKYFKAMGTKWARGATFKMFFSSADISTSQNKKKPKKDGGKFYQGSIKACEPLTEDKFLPWEALHVQWDDNGADGSTSSQRVNPWEIEATINEVPAARVSAVQQPVVAHQPRQSVPGFGQPNFNLNSHVKVEVAANPFAMKSNPYTNSTSSNNLGGYASYGLQQPAATVVPRVNPGPWHSKVDEASGNTYYWNVITKEVTWDRPAGFVDPPVTPSYMLGPSSTNPGEQLITVKGRTMTVEQYREIMRRVEQKKMEQTLQQMP
jgi:hypothetical protein